MENCQRLFCPLPWQVHKQREQYVCGGARALVARDLSTCCRLGRSCPLTRPPPPI